MNKELNKEILDSITKHKDFGTMNPIDIGVQCGYTEEDVIYAIENYNDVMSHEESEELEIGTPVYDGSDISRKCADVIKTKAYIELDNYLVYLKDKELVRVSKKTGEEKNVDVVVGLFLDLKDNVCAWRNRVYFVNSANYKTYICSIDVETMEEEKIEYIGETFEYASDRKLKVNGNYVIYRTRIEKEKRLVCYNIEDKTTTLLSFLHPERGYEMDVNYFYLAGDDIFFKAHGVYKYNLLSKEVVCVQEELDFSESSFLQYEVKCYEGILYSIDPQDLLNNKFVYFIDLENPLSLQRAKLPGNKENEYHLHNGKVYYVTVDADSEFGCYDIKNKKHMVIMKNCPLVGGYQDGRKRIYVQPNGQIVGKWFYGNHTCFGCHVVDISGGEIDIIDKSF